MTNRDPWVAFFDQAARPSRLVLGKKFFHIWFIYTREGCVLVLHLFFCKVSFMKHPTVRIYGNKDNYKYDEEETDNSVKAKRLDIYDVINKVEGDYLKAFKLVERS